MRRVRNAVATEGTTGEGPCGAIEVERAKLGERESGEVSHKAVGVVGRSFKARETQVDECWCTCSDELSKGRVGIIIGVVMELEDLKWGWRASEDSDGGRKRKAGILGADGERVKLRPGGDGAGEMERW